MRSFYMVRHGETTTNLDRIATGQMDVVLTEKGKQQAAECRDIIRARGIQPAAIVCSGLIRTKQTADIVNQELQRPLYQHLELNEQHYGDWEGKHWDVVLPEIEEHGENPPNGESLQAFQVRTTAAIRNLLDQYDGTLLFVTHAGVFTSMFSEYGHPPSKVKNCVLYEFMFSEAENILLDVLTYT